jgi:hypothetical protein
MLPIKNKPIVSNIIHIFILTSLFN